jgi:TRAP transporter T-component
MIRTRRPSPLLLVLLALVAATQLGCIESMLTNGQISATRRASGAFGTIGDYELARSAASAGLVQFEGMHRLAPKNADALFMLASGWAGYGFAFAEDDMEVAEVAGNDELAEYHKKRALLAYDRAVAHGLDLLGQKDAGMPAARKNADTLKKWLTETFTDKEDAAGLFWTGYAWLLRTQLLRDVPEVVADLFVGVSLIERSVELDPEFMHRSGIVALAAYHARAHFAELAESKRLFDDVLAKTQHKSFVVQLTYARTYACVTVDRKLYETLVNEVLSAEDGDPEQRLNNTIAKRRAKRLLGKQRMMDCGFDMSEPTKAPAAKKE